MKWLIPSKGVVLVGLLVIIFWNIGSNMDYLEAIETKQEAVATTEVAVPACVIEQWTWREDSIGNIWVSGTTTCQSGKITMSLYDGEVFLGNVTTGNYISNGTFEGFSKGHVTGKTLSIKYSIQ